jgi:hypothetical protein
MVQESVLTDNSINEVRRFIKKLIPQIKGKVINEGSRRIVWTYLFKGDTIVCETNLTSFKIGTKITTSTKDYGLLTPKAKEQITKFYSALGQKFKIKELKEIPQKNEHIRSNFNWVNRWNVIAIIGFIIFGLIFIEIYPSAQVKNSSWDNSVPQVERYLKRILQYPNSFEPIMWSKVYDMNHNDYGYRYKVRVKYNAKNSFGVMETQSQLFYLTENGIIINVE